MTGFASIRGVNGFGIGVDKGRAVKRWIDQGDWDFIMGVGDDWTDEDMFEVLPEIGYSIKVGYVNSNARFNMKNVAEVRSMISDLVRVDRT